MSNIITSYYEIYRTDGQHIRQKDRGRIYRGMIKAYDQFASYWVRIYVEYDSKKRCIRIQHGCGKSYADRELLIESEWFSSHFFLWSRWADEGSLRDGLRIESFGGLTKDIAQVLEIKGERLGSAQYSFDGLLLGGTVHHFNQIVQSRNLLGTRHFLAVAGTYEGLTNRSMIDMTPEFNGPSLGYESKYRPRRFVPEYLDLQRINWHALADVLPSQFADFFVVEPDLEFVALCWQKRVVYLSSRRGFFDKNDSFPATGLSAAGWANLTNPAYLAFSAWHAEQVLWADQTL
ncbi:hypothetical protein FNU79_08000 [Deinococcus detaillensis]|uniref:Uncharacterized protein n=1 Tax=Deinococcus detaillensis TaxID=2592048 RepID=A0A553V0X0_9DEIO|nr:hypothetical protein [Deinococcus detaillensis]TSA86119.1 hypothetical protein FNU79_08000 [Deinococcus detaillensis]